MKNKRVKKDKLYKRVYQGRLYTGYNKDMLDDLIISKKRGQ